MNDRDRFEYESYDEISLSELYQIVKRGFWLAVCNGAVAATATFVVSRNLEPTFQAESTLLAARTNASDMQRFGVSLATAPAVDVNAYRAAATSGPVLKEALASSLETGGEEAVGLSVAALRESVDITTESTNTSSLLRVKVQHNSPEVAASLSNAIAAELIEWDAARATRHLEEIVQILDAQIRAIDSGIEALQASGAAPIEEISGRVALREQQRQQLFYARTMQQSAMGLLEVIDPAVTPLDAVAPRPRLSAALAFVLGVFVSYGLFFVRMALNTRVRDSDELSRRTNLPVLAEFPVMPGEQRRLPADAVRYLRTNVLFALSSVHPKVILVASASSGEGKSSVALSLAESFVRNGHRTLLVDADLRKPVIGGMYGLKSGIRELADYLEDPTLPLTPASIAMEGGNTLAVVPTIRPAKSPTELLANGFREWISIARDLYDVIVIDSAPLLPVADSLTIAPHVSASLLVARVGETDVRDIEAAKGLLDRLGVQVAGVIATSATSRSQRARSGYGYGYGAGYGAEDVYEPEVVAVSKNRDASSRVAPAE